MATAASSTKGKRLQAQQQVQKVIPVGARNHDEGTREADSAPPRLQSSWLYALREVFLLLRCVLGRHRRRQSISCLDRSPSPARTHSARVQCRLGWPAGSRVSCSEPRDALCALHAALRLPVPDLFPKRAISPARSPFSGSASSAAPF